MLTPSGRDDTQTRLAGPRLAKSITGNWSFSKGSAKPIILRVFKKTLTLIKKCCLCLEIAKVGQNEFI